MRDMEIKAKVLYEIQENEQMNSGRIFIYLYLAKKKKTSKCFQTFCLF